jgi:hypothetical protein
MKNVWKVTLAAAVMQTLVANASAQSPQAPPARAQTGAALTTTAPTFELSASYQFLHAPAQDFPFGLNVDGVRHFGSIGAVAEIGWAHGDDDDGINVPTDMWNFGAGGRWTGFGSRRTWPYGQVIIGAAVANGSGDTATSFMVQPGVGLTVVSGDGWGMFGQLDYRRTFFDEPDDAEDGINNHFRFLVGLRMILD